MLTHKLADIFPLYCLWLHNEPVATAATAQKQKESNLVWLCFNAFCQLETRRVSSLWPAGSPQMTGKGSTDRSLRTAAAGIIDCMVLFTRRMKSVTLITVTALLCQIIHFIFLTECITTNFWANRLHLKIHYYLVEIPGSQTLKNSRSETLCFVKRHQLTSAGNLAHYLRGQGS